MARPKTEYRNEVKSRLRDRTFEAMQRYMQIHGVSESRAIADLADIALFGFDGTLPALLTGNYPQSAVFGPETAFHK